MSKLLTVTVQGQPRIEAVFEALADALDQTEILDQGSAILLNRIRTRYLAQTDPDGNQWEVSKAAMLRAKRGRGGGTGFDTGRLFNSIQLFSLGDSSRGIGTDVPYAGYFQSIGSPPERVFMGFNDDDAETMQDFILKRIVEALNGISSS